MSTDIKDKLKTNSQKRENIKLNLILIIYLTLIQSRLCHCCLKYPTPTRHCQKWKITNYSLLINKNGTSAQAFILLLFSIVSTKRSVGEFTNSLLHSCPCCATMLQFGAEISHLSTQKNHPSPTHPKGDLSH